MDDPNLLESHCKFISHLVERNQLSQALDFWKLVKPVFCIDKGEAETLGSQVTLLVFIGRTLSSGLNNEDRSNIFSEVSKEVEYCLKKAVSLDGNCVDSLLGLGDFYQLLNEISLAKDYYLKVLKLSPSNVDAHCALGTLYKNEGNVDLAFSSYKNATELTSYRDPTHVFNLAYCYEYLDQCEEGLILLENFLSTNDPHEMQSTVNHYMIYLLYIKLLYLCGDYGKKISTVVEAIRKFPPFILQYLMRMKTHWAYFVFLSNLSFTIEPSLEVVKKLYIVGDSHCLSVAWQRIQLANGTMYILVPKLITGLMAYHLRTTRIKQVTIFTLHTILQNLSRTEKKILFCAGEIDCRLGIGPAVQKGKYKSIQEALRTTVNLYVGGLSAFVQQYKMQFFILPVPPPSSLEQQDRVNMVNQFNSEMKTKCISSDAIYFLDYAHLLCSNDGTLQKNFYCDGTHMNANFLPLLVNQLNYVNFYE